MRNYINITVDTKIGANFFYTKTSYRLIGERYGRYVVQVPSIAQAKRAIKTYKKYVESLGYRRASTNYSEGVYADIGNHTAFNHLKIEELKKEAFYLEF